MEYPQRSELSLEHAVYPAAGLRHAGWSPNFAEPLGARCDSATKRLVQRWEAGRTINPRPSHARALEKVMGLPIETVAFW